MAFFMLYRWSKWKQKAKNGNGQGNDPKRARVKAILMPVDKCHSVFKSAWIKKFSWLKYDSAALSMNLHTPIYHIFFSLQLQSQRSGRLSQETTSKKTVAIPADWAVQPDPPTATDSYLKSTLATLKLLGKGRDKLSLSSFNIKSS